MVQFTEAGHNGVMGGLLVAKHVERELGLVLGLVPIPHRQITDDIVSDLVNSHVIVILPAQVITIHITIKHNMNEGILARRGSCKTVATKLTSTEKCAFNLSKTRKIS